MAEKKRIHLITKIILFLLIQLKTNLNWHKQASRFSSETKL